MNDAESTYCYAIKLFAEGEREKNRVPAIME